MTAPGTPPSGTARRLRPVPAAEAPPAGRWRRFARGLRQALWGLFVYELHHETMVQRRQLEQAMNLLLLGEFLGLPVMSAPVTLRLLPYIVGDLARFKETASEEWDFIEHAPHLH